MRPDQQQGSVLAILDADIERQRIGVAAGRCDPDAMAEFEDMRDAVAEYIAANEEYDALNSEWARLTDWIVSCAPIPQDYSQAATDDLRNRINVCKGRRALAHARMRGGSVMNEECEVCSSTEWSPCDDSFDHEFGTERIAPYLMCCGCDTARPMPEREY